jgi:beta-lactamase class A
LCEYDSLVVSKMMKNVHISCDLIRHQFQAMPLNEKILSQHGLGVKPVPCRSITVPEPFKLSTGNHKVTADANETTHQTVFHANPLPTSILQGVVVSIF